MTKLLPGIAPSKPITTPKQLVKAYEKYGSLKAIARITGTPWLRTHKLYEQAVVDQLMDPIRPGAKTRTHMAAVISGEVKAKRVKGGKLKAMRTRKLAPLPEAGDIHRFFFTSAQNSTSIPDKLWENVNVFCEARKAKLFVSRFAYIKAGFGAAGDKAGWMNNERFKAVRDLEWDPRLVPHFMDTRMEVAPGLVFCGEMNISPTAVSPLSGFSVYTGRKSMIMPHPKLQMESIATMQDHATKFNYTTGTLTMRNYIQRAAGLKAEFGHVYGGLLVEVDSGGNWWCRQINADSNGTLYDLDLRVKDGKAEYGHWVENYGSGDVHVIKIDPTVRRVKWGPGGVIDVLRPRSQCIHDVIDFFSRSHHTIDNPHKMFLRHINGEEDVAEEFRGVGNFLLEDAARDFCETIVVNSNHDRHPERWLTERNGLKDPVNAQFWIELQAAIYRYMRTHGTSADALVEGLGLHGWHQHTWNEYGVTFLPEDASYVVCPDANGGIECGMHGDRAGNGARGSLRAFARMGRKANVFHSHSAGIFEGVDQGGTSSLLKLEYVKGPSSHSHTDIVTYENGKRSLLTMWDGRYWAEQAV